jgi:hypothetical protein
MSNLSIYKMGAGPFFFLKKKKKFQTLNSGSILIIGVKLFSIFFVLFFNMTVSQVDDELYTHKLSDFGVLKYEIA